MLDDLRDMMHLKLLVNELEEPSGFYHGRFVRAAEQMTHLDFVKSLILQNQQSISNPAYRAELSETFKTKIQQI